MMRDLFACENIETLSVNGELNGAQYYSWISKIMKNIHSKIEFLDFDTKRIATTADIREEYFEGRNYKRVVMFLLSNGCEWALKSGNGCTVCGHLAKQTGSDISISADDYLCQFKSEFAKIDFQKTPILNLYNNGSFFNDNEIPAIARREMFNEIGRNPYIKMLVIETRPEFITEQSVDELKQLIPDKHVEIAIGLEVYDDTLRKICINKGFSLKQYRKAAGIVTSKVGLRTYVMLKPPFLDERESIEQAVQTITYAFESGSTTVSLEACTVQDYTLVKHLYDLNYFRPPWLWSIVEVIKRTHHLGKLVVGLFQFYPSPQKVPYNCDKCSERFIDALKNYNNTLDIRAFDGLSCECSREWELDLSRESGELEERVEMMLASNLMD